MNQDEYYSDEDEDDEPLEAYCVRCKQTVEIENPQAVWTRRGMPCSITLRRCVTLATADPCSTGSWIARSVRR